MPISYSKDICLSLNIFSISRVYPSLLVPKSDKFNTKPLPSYSKGDRFYFYLIDIYNIFCSCALCMLACVFLYLRVQCRYLVCQILWLHYLEKYLQSILLMCMYVCVFPSPCGYLVCRILWQVEIRWLPGMSLVSLYNHSTILQTKIIITITNIMIIIDSNDLLLSCFNINL